MTKGDAAHAVSSAQVVKDVWRELLPVDDGPLDSDANFFDVGGHSLLAVELVARIEERAGVPIPLGDIFLDGRLRSLVAAVEEAYTAGG
ncbi:MAG: acyl carrier protein [Gaiellaceae bacterium]